jgi:histidinol dehydrogenase
MTATLLRRCAPDESAIARAPALNPEALSAARAIIDDVAARGLPALRHHAERLGDLKPGEPLLLDRADLARRAATITPSDAAVLHRTADRIRAFADAQRRCLTDLDMPVQGGAAGHRVLPVARAGCYSPGGRFPLPSSTLMTAVTARAAGVPFVVVASPRPSPATLAAAHIAGADALLAAGGAHAVAALALGFDTLAPVDLIVGPGNRYVTAAKFLLSDRVGIDALAGPSELVIIADDSADPRLVAADLLAQAEHDPDAIPILISTSDALITAAERELARQLESLPTAPVARAALTNGRAILVPSLSDAASLSDRLAPEHLQLMTRDDERLSRELRSYGSLFIGPRSAEVLGDYGAGPNHVLPTGGTARFAAGLSVFHFLKPRTYLRINDAPNASALAHDAAALARLEGLEAHARAADARSLPR